MKKIILVSRVFPPKRGGIENMIFNIYSRLEGVRVIAPDFEGWEKFDRSNKMDVQRVFVRPRFLQTGKFPLPFLSLAALKACSQNIPDQIHCDQVQSGIVGLLLKQIFHKPTVVYAYGMEITDGGSMPMKSAILNRADKVIAISAYTKKELMIRHNVPEEKIYTVHPGTDIRHFHPGVDPNDIRERYHLGNKKVILSVGRLDRDSSYKNFDAVIGLMPFLIKSVPDAVYLIVGSGNDMKRLKLIAQKEKVEDKVIFASDVSYNDLPKFYRAADVFVMVSGNAARRGGKGDEGFGIVYAEAGACGIPVVAGNEGGAVDIVRNGLNGLTVNPEDKNAIAAAIINLLSNDRLRTAMGHRGREFVANKFTWDASANRLKAMWTRSESDGMVGV